MADCGLRRIAALAGLGRIADCMLGALRRKDPSAGRLMLIGVAWRCLQRRTVRGRRGSLPAASDTYLPSLLSG
eukprot:15460481-Alexandrium_andersonii.AAC.1